MNKGKKIYTSNNIILGLKKSGLNYVERNSVVTIIILYNLITLFFALAFYPIIPILLNYPPNNEEVSMALGTSNLLQYLVLLVYSCMGGDDISDKGPEGF